MVPLLIPRSNALDEPAAWSHHLTNFDAASARQAARAVTAVQTRALHAGQWGPETSVLWIRIRSSVILQALKQDRQPLIPPFPVVSSGRTVKLISKMPSTKQRGEFTA
jgi:hypothetical protein